MRELEQGQAARAPIVTGMYAHTGTRRKKLSAPHLIGGPGYTINRYALERLGSSIGKRCFENKVYAPEEDKYVSYCFEKKLGVQVIDSRDYTTGEERYHNFNAETVYTGITDQHQAYERWLREYRRNRVHPSIANMTVGEKRGMDGAYEYSVSFHQVKTTELIVRYTAILYKLCPE